MMLISPRISANPYETPQYIEMIEKLDSLCGKGFSEKNLQELKTHLKELSKENKTLNKSVCRQLNRKMMHNASILPCAEAFESSIYIEFYKNFRNHPIEEAIEFIECLPIMSKN